MRTSLAFRFIPLVIAASLAGCSEHSTGVAPTEPTRAAPTGAQSMLSMTCSVSVSTHAVSCGNPMTNDEAFADVIIGGQLVYVTLTSANVVTSVGSDCPDAGTPDPTKSCLAFDLTVKNLIPQPLGTADTTANHVLDPNGVRVFFQSGPTSTGTGTVILANPDGTGAFTGTNQPYYQFNQVLAQNITSTSKHWEFQYSPDVLGFTFTVYVSTAVPYPDGYIDGLARVITLNHSGFYPLQGTSRSFVGNDDGASIVWTSANPSVASVSGNQVLSASTNGATTITGQSGLRPGTTTTWISVCPSTVVVDGTNLSTDITGFDCFSALNAGDGYLPGSSYFGDLYRVTLVAGQTVEITMDTGNILDSYLVLADRLGNILAENDDDPLLTLGLGSRLTFIAPASGVAVIQATTFNTFDVGNYILGVSIH